MASPFTHTADRNLLPKSLFTLFYSLHIGYSLAPCILALFCFCSLCVLYVADEYSIKAELRYKEIFPSICVN